MRQDCRFFRPDTPCVFHKETGRSCGKCGECEPVRRSILLIKRDALGDVLRTTSVLEPLKRKYPGSRIVWLVSDACRPVLEGNVLIDAVWTDNACLFGAHTLFSFHLVINLDLAFESLVLAGQTRARRKLGFWYLRNGRIACSGDAARTWLSMSHDDGIKKRNTLTYQEHVRRICGLDGMGRIIVPLSRESAAKAEEFRRGSIPSGKTVIGVNVGSGARWKTKRWPEENFLRLFSLLGQRYAILLFGGPEERPVMERLVRNSEVPVVDTGSGNSVPDFFAFLNLCSLVVTADTMALHAALGLGKKTVALFAPTSESEIEMYGLGTKLSCALACRCCYLRDCGRYPSCMETISAERVAEAVGKLLHA